MSRLMLSAGIKLGPYQIQSAIGAGGMGEVYRALDTRLDRLVAVKILPPQLTISQQALERFQREAKAVAALSHPNICAIYDIGEAPSLGDHVIGRHEEKIHFIVMELLEGEPLQRRLARGSLDVTDVIGMGAALSDALDSAHSKGILHRDIKPANVFLTARGPQILDFGLAKTVSAPSGSIADSMMPTGADESLTNSGIAIGTVPYMSPEQLRGDELDARSDLFSLGLVLYEMAAGRPTFSRRTFMETAAAILHEQPTPPRHMRPELPAGLESIILKTIDKNRGNRTQSASELRAELHPLKRELESTESSAKKTPVSRYRLGAAVLATTVLLVLVAGAYFMRAHTPPPAPLPAAAEPAKEASPVPVAAEPAADQPSAVQPDAAPQPLPADSIFGLKATRLTISGNADRPAISPDGKLIVYVQHGQGDSLWLRQTNQPRTANDVPIIPAEPGAQIFGATVTPDGTNVDYLRGTSSDIQELWRAPLFGGSRKRIVDKVNSLPGWSPAVSGWPSSDGTWRRPRHPSLWRTRTAVTNAN
ncbi:MAG TPA: protein kinase [Candidatus Binatia bacterium]